MLFARIPRWACLIVLATRLRAAPHTAAADLGRQVLTAGLDPNECYRVRDVSISRDFARFSFTDGYLIFGRPVAGRPVTVVFTASAEGGDAEVLMLPPDRAERKSMAFYTGSPNLNEHFSQAAFLFSDETARELMDQIRTAGTERAPDIGAAMLDQWGPTIGNLMTSFESRMVLDFLTPGGAGNGFFEAILQGRRLGNFDIVYDSRSYEQVIAGQVAEHNGVSRWETWSSFPERSQRGLPPSPPEQQILSYQIDVTLDASLTMHCVTRMKVRATEASRKVLAFDLSGRMQPTSAKVDGVPAEVYERASVRDGLVRNNGNELLMVAPEAPLEPGSIHEVEIAHEGKVIQEAGHNVFYVSARGTWYPARDLQYATYDVTYRYPKDLDLVAAGRVMEDRTEGDQRITRRVPDGPVHLLGFNLGKYQRVRVERAGITVEVCANNEVEDALRPRPVVTPPDVPEMRGRMRGLGPSARVNDVPIQLPLPVPADQNARIADEVENAAAFYRAKFGEPALKHIEVTPIPVRFGQGFAGMIYLPTSNYLRTGGEDSPTDQKLLRDLLTAHEVAHQWWGNVVSSGSYHHEWIMEALASYSAILYLESKFGPKANEKILEVYRHGLFLKGPDGETNESEGPVVQGRRLEGSANPSAWNAVIYGKGTWIMHMLRRRLGDERFFKMLAEVRRRYEWKTLDTESFRLLCAEFLPAGSTDAKLETFFDQWVYGTGVPALKLSYTVKGKPGAYKLTGTVAQTDAPEDFSVTVPIEIQTGRGKPVVHLVHTTDSPVSFSVPVAATTAKAVLDPGWSVLRR
ncbi:MAG: M1 family aminopeptidase [Terriglobia bacterium]